MNTQDKPSDKLIIRANRSGIIIDKKAIAGNMVSPGDPLFIIGNTDVVWFEGEVYPEDLSKIRLGQDVAITVDDGGEPVFGKVSLISPFLSTGTHTTEMHVEISNTDNRLRIGMYVKASVTIGKLTDLALPVECLIQVGKSFYFFKRLPGNIFQRISIESSLEKAGSLPIPKSLSIGDEVVSKGALLLNAVLMK